MKSLNRAVIVLVFNLVLGAAFRADADEPERNVAGLVAAKGPDSISIAVRETKRTETFALTKETQFLRGRDPMAASDLAVGEVALVHAKKIDGQEIAVSVSAKPRR